MDYGDKGRRALKCMCTRYGTTEYQMSDLDDIEFYWENDSLDVDAAFSTEIETPFSPTAFDDFEMGG